MKRAIVLSSFFFSFAPAKLDQRELTRNERTALATVDGNGFESLRLLEACSTGPDGSVTIHQARG